MTEEQPASSQAESTLAPAPAPSEAQSSAETIPDPNVSEIVFDPAGLDALTGGAGAPPTEPPTGMDYFTKDATPAAETRETGTDTGDS